MKKLLLLILMSPSIVLAASVCGDLGDYDVATQSFTQMPFSDAVKNITRGTPFQLVMRGNIDKTVTANNVSGPLDQVLDAMTKRATVTYSRDRCVITLSPTTDHGLHLKTGDLLSEKLSAWVKSYGYSLSWDDRVSRAGADVTLDLGFDETLSAFKNVMASNGSNLDITTHKKSHFVQIEELK